MLYLTVIAQGDLPRAGANDQGVHERGDHHWSQVAGRVRPSVLQVLRPDKAEQVQEESTFGTSVQ